MIDKNPKTGKTETFYIDIDGEKECVVNVPTFDQMIHALSLMGEATMPDQAKAGKQIFELCCVSHDEAFNDNSNMFSLCQHLAIEYVLPTMRDVKKK